MLERGLRKANLNGLKVQENKRRRKGSGILELINYVQNPNGKILTIDAGENYVSIRVDDKPEEDEADDYDEEDEH